MIGRSKYRAKKITVDGVTYDSKKEYKRFCDLALLERAGHIQDLQRQVRITLIPSQKDPETGKTLERPVYYIADFVYRQDGREIVEDVKGYKTKEYILKRKLLLWVHGIRIKEV